MDQKEKNGRFCGPSCQCINCTNSHEACKEWNEVNELEVEGHEDNWENEEYTDDSENEEQVVEMKEDEELKQIMDFVFGEEFDED